MRGDNLKGHMKVHLKYSNITPQSTEDICRDLVLDLVYKVVAPVEESSRINWKHEEVECKTQTTGNKDQSNKRYEGERVFGDNCYNSIDVQALRKSRNMDEQQYILKIELGREVYKYLHETKIMQESLSKERLEAWDLYIK